MLQHPFFEFISFDSTSSSRRTRQLVVVTLLIGLALAASCASSNEKPLVASPKLLSSLKQERDALRKKIASLKTIGSRARKKVRPMLKTIMFPTTGIGAVNTNASSVAIRWKTQHAKTSLAGNLRPGDGSENSVSATIKLKKGKR